MLRRAFNGRANHRRSDRRRYRALGTTQHLKALLAIRGEGGLALKSGDRLMPEPVLLGHAELEALAKASGGLKWSTDRDACLADKTVDIYFDAAPTGGRTARLTAAIAAGKAVYTEKPAAETLEQALSLARQAKQAGVKNGMVPDKVFLPGLKKLRKLFEANYFGRVLSIKLDFGWWVFDGDLYPSQRVRSWNYKRETGERIILDMFAHWRYVFDRLLGPIEAVTCRSRPRSHAVVTRPALRLTSMSTTTPSRCSSSKAASRRRSVRPGRAASNATTCCKSRSMAPRARQCAGCTAALSSRSPRHRDR